MCTAYLICVVTTFSLVPRKRLIRKCCLIDLKSNSTCQRFFYKAVMVSGCRVVLLVRNTSVERVGTLFIPI